MTTRARRQCSRAHPGGDCNTYKGLLQALIDQDVQRVWNYYNDPFLSSEFTGSGNHDEGRGSNLFAGDLLEYGSAVATTLLMGGATTMLAGDEYREARQLRFKAKGVAFRRCGSCASASCRNRIRASRIGSGEAADSRPVIYRCAERCGSG